ncbi:uncharacterized protein LOC104897263 [Beta vulgaris subsp. vulgaris]|uniref:uncharacterized protein LOC104897263 n=1 Tax=Beta vulgaris subsp. vulgaris TaxID=3555 RepID=UPI002036696C|nr:uncharacterized protein LOC104897263 [Beta vulgaris subsp. vulgaris]
MASERLQTRDKLVKFGVCEEDTCMLCDAGKEDQQHLFFECIYSRKCLQAIKEWLGIHTTSRNIVQILDWTRRRYRGSNFRRKVVRAGIIAVVYKIWQERNNVLWNSQVRTIVSVVNDVKYIVKERVRTRLGKKVKDRDVVWLQSL